MPIGFLMTSFVCHDLELSDVDVLRVDTHLHEENDNDSCDEDDDDDSKGRDSIDDQEGKESSHGSDHKPLELAQGDMIDPSNPTIQIEFAVGELNDNPIINFLATNSESSDDGDVQNNNLDGNDDAKERKRVVTNLLAVNDKFEFKQPPSKKSLITEL